MDTMDRRCSFHSSNLITFIECSFAPFKFIINVDLNRWWMLFTDLCFLKYNWFDLLLLLLQAISPVMWSSLDRYLSILSLYDMRYVWRARLLLRGLKVQSPFFNQHFNWFDFLDLSLGVWSCIESNLSGHLIAWCGSVFLSLRAHLSLLSNGGRS